MYEIPKAMLSGKLVFEGHAFLWCRWTNKRYMSLREPCNLHVNWTRGDREIPAGATTYLDRELEFEALYTGWSAIMFEALDGTRMALNVDPMPVRTRQRVILDHKATQVSVGS